MQRILIPSLACAAFFACGTSDHHSANQMTYPTTHQDSLAGDTLHGTFVPDPYRWLENDTSAGTAAWVKEQNAVTQAYLSQIPFRNDLAKRYEELYNFR